MNKITTNEIVTFDNGKEYYSFRVLNQGDFDYIYLISTKKPIELRILKQEMIDGTLSIKTVDDKEEKIHALNLFHDSHKTKHLVKDDNSEQ